ncbi:MAG: archaeosortase/exosortase family protein, partial [Candidatus Thiodiazotropha sp.]
MTNVEVIKGWKTSSLVWLILAVTAILLCYGFWGGIKDFIRIWSAREEYGYAYFIPFISAYLIWQRRDQLILETF